MSKTTVIFALSPKEAEFAVEYVRKHPKEKVKILSPDLPAQLVLCQQGLSHDDYFIKEYFVKNYFTKTVKKYEKISVELTNSLLKKLINVFPEYKNYLLPLQNRLELAYLELIDAYHYFQTMDNLWKADRYLIDIFYLNPLHGQYSTYRPSRSQAANIFKFFISDKKKGTFSVFKDSRRLPLILRKLKHYLGSPQTWPGKIKALSLRLADKGRHLILPINPKKVDILIFSSGRNLNYYYRLLHLLSKETSYDYQVVTNIQLLQDELALRKNRISFIPLSYFERFIDTGRINKQSSRIQQDIDDWYKQQKADDLFKVEMDSFLKKSLYQRTREIVSNHLSQQVKQALLAEKVVDFYKPKLIITTHDPGPSALPFVLAGRDKNVSSVVLMHGWQDTLMGVNYHSDKLVVWGPYIAKWYVKEMKKNPKTIITAGYPAFDQLFLTKEAFWQRRGNVEQLPEIVNLSLLLTMYLPNTALLTSFLNDLFKSICRVKNKYNLEIRTHPGQLTDGIKELADYYQLSVVVNREISLTEFIKSSDVVLSWDTTAMFWVMIYGKPLFYCSPLWDWGNTPVKELGGGWLARSPSDLLEKIEKLRSDKSLLVGLRQGQLNFLKQIIGELRGRSAEKHLRFICQLLS